MNSYSNNAAWNDFNDAEDQREYALIPPKTLAKVIMAIRPGGYDGLQPRRDQTQRALAPPLYRVCSGPGFVVQRG